MSERDSVPSGRRVLVEGRFDPKLRTYLFLQVLLLLVVTIVGIVLVPFWLLLGHFWTRRYYEHYHCLLTERGLVVKRGVLFRRETTIPLDKVQDLSIRHGPLLNALGLASLSLDTAGFASGAGGRTELKGLVDVVAFRDRVLEQRDRVTDLRDRGEKRATDSSGGGAESLGDRAEPVRLLREIRDSLLRLEERLSDGPVHEPGEADRGEGAPSEVA